MYMGQLCKPSKLAPQEILHNFHFLHFKYCITQAERLMSKHFEGSRKGILFPSLCSIHKGDSSSLYLQGKGEWMRLTV